jgi:hypothetical protein
VCGNIVFIIPEEEVGSIESSRFSILIFESRDGLGGLVAELQIGSELASENDLEITTPAKESFSPIYEFVPTAVPAIKWEK